ncbi:MAG: GNAT family N-acetyltransferase [Flavobacteriaceae bacterium]
MTDLTNWKPRPRPPQTPMTGRLVTVEPVAERHLPDLWAAYSAPGADPIWDYLPYGPFAGEDAFRDFARATYFGADPMFHAIVDRQGGRALGVASLMRIDEKNGVIEVGHINYAPALQKTPAATEAMYLLMRRVFDELGYRRYEWKCDNRNEGSKRAAVRLGFDYEGLFRQHLIVKGRNRDTAWFSIVDGEWPALKARFEAWLDPANFDADGRQRRTLGG